jgi:hypothetical protein
MAVDGADILLVEKFAHRHFAIAAHDRWDREQGRSR